MIRSRSSLALAALLTLLFAMDCRADDGFKWSDLNPFSGNGNAGSNKGPGFQLTQQEPAPKPKKPPIWSNWGRTTTRTMNQTVNFLNPWSKSKAKKPAARPPLTGGRIVESPNANEKQGNWFTRMFAPSPEPEQPRTASQFIALPRVK